jgi:riboflavin synthase
MFTGIIEELGKIRRITNVREGARLEVWAQTVLENTRIGDSIAVNGVCLTVIDQGSDWFAADISAETLHRTSLKQARIGTNVNLERPLSPSSRLGGHIVQGHVDSTGELIGARPAGEGWEIRIGFQREIARYIVEKGSITVDGISLTIAKLEAGAFSVAIIPHTWKVTNLSTLERGAMVNLEVDIIAKYVERMIEPYIHKPKEGLSLEKLAEFGY